MFKWWVWLFTGKLLKFLREYTATQPQVKQILAGNEKIEVGNLSAGYYNDLKLLMVKELVMTWIRINENENTKTNISNILKTEEVRQQQSRCWNSSGMRKSKNGNFTMLAGIKQSENEAVMEKIVRWWYDE